jgi:hypothetical protein
MIFFKLNKIELIIVLEFGGVFAVVKKPLIVKLLDFIYLFNLLKQM